MTAMSELYQAANNFVKLLIVTVNWYTFGHHKALGNNLSIQWPCPGITSDQIVLPT